jgi:hypothetical protein
VTERADPSAAGTGGQPAFEPFRLERETKPDGRAILFYSWPDAPPIPEGLGNVAGDARTTDEEAEAPHAEPWSPETQPTDRTGRDA